MDALHEAVMARCWAPEDLPAEPRAGRYPRLSNPGPVVTGLEDGGAAAPVEVPEGLSRPEEALLAALRSIPDGPRVAAEFGRLAAALARARSLHPRFAEQEFHALGCLSEEHGEAVKEVTKQKPGWQDRMDAELRDLVVVALRMIFREYRHPEPDGLHGGASWDA